MTRIDNNRQWDALQDEIVNCRKCPRLVAWREEVALKKRRAFMGETYWGKAVPGFGDHNARILILGLAPGAHGSNRSGRMFTGDASGDFLYPALYRAGFASQPASAHVGDGLALQDVFISAVCRCAPPGNKPTREEQQACRPYLLREMHLLENLQGIVALGGIAFASACDLLQEVFGEYGGEKPKFGHNAFYAWPQAPIWLLGAYHPSRQNTQTGRLSAAMFAEIWEHAKQLLEEK
jgi:uracil-DNA glycosylase family 4